MEAFDETKFRELILYFAQRCASDVFFGATKLNKYLFYTDFLAFRERGRSVTGARYQAIEHGPAPRQLKPVQDRMIEAKLLTIEPRGKQLRVRANSPSEPTHLTSEDIHFAERALEQIRHLDAQGVSDLSHEFPGWAAARVEQKVRGGSDEIPYTTAYVRATRPTEDEIAHGLQLARLHGWPID